MNQEGNERIFYLRKEGTRAPIGVVALRLQGQTLRIASSLCSKTDQFSKALGRAKAIGRLNSEENCVVCERNKKPPLANVLDSLGIPWEKQGVDIDEAQGTLNNLVRIMNRNNHE